MRGTTLQTLKRAPHRHSFKFHFHSPSFVRYSSSSKFANRTRPENFSPSDRPLIPARLEPAPARLRSARSIICRSISKPNQFRDSINSFGVCVGRFFEHFDFDLMATRNRTILFRRYRDALKSVRVPSGSSATSSGGRGGPVIELTTTSLLNPNRSYTPLSTEDPGTSSRGTVAVGLPPAWVDVSEEIATNIQRVRGKMAELSKAHAKALMPSFGDGKEDQRQIEALTHEITNLLKKSEKRLQRLSSGGPAEDSNIRKNVQRSLATDLQTLSMELRKKQSTYLKRLRQQKEGSDGVDLEMNLNGSKSTREDDDDMDDIGFSEHQLAKIKKSEAFTAEREREIQQVVESVNDLAQIMKDLSVLVIDQGTIVDRIDYNITNVAASVEDGLKQLQKAERSQKQGGMVMCATVLIIMCFVMLVLLILKEIIF